MQENRICDIAAAVTSRAIVLAGLLILGAAAGCELDLLSTRAPATGAPNEGPESPRMAAIGNVELFWHLGSVVTPEQVGFEPIILMTAHFIYDMGAKDTGRWTLRDKTDWFIGNRIPRGYNGYVALDWEGVGLRVLRDPDHPDYAAVRSDFLELLHYVKRHRPNARVGYYSLPFREYWKQDDNWVRANDGIRSIIAASDAVFPSCYDFYGEAEDRDARRFARIIEESLRLADGKPVIAWIMPQYHNSTEDWGERRIPDDELAEHVQALIEVEVDGDRLDGICMFGGGIGGYKSAFERKNGQWAYPKATAERTRAFYDEEMRPGESIEAFHKRWHTHVACVLKQAVRNIPCRDGYQPGRRARTVPMGE